jgi:hypothetical protein
VAVYRAYNCEQVGPAWVSQRQEGVAGQAGTERAMLPGQVVSEGQEDRVAAAMHRPVDLAAQAIARAARLVMAVEV